MGKFLNIFPAMKPIIQRYVNIFLNKIIMFRWLFELLSIKILYLYKLLTMTTPLVSKLTCMYETLLEYYI